jgi:hypothetical protein
LRAKHLQGRKDRAAGGNGPTKLHVADIANGCERAVWNRIHNGLESEFDDLTRKKMEYGLRYEQTVFAALEEAGYECLHGTTIDYLGVVGHPDLYTYLKNGADERHLIEIKTTMLFRDGYGAPQHPDRDTLRKKSTQYVLQACFYAKALRAPSFTIHVSDRGTGADRDYHFTTDEEWPAVEERLQAMRAVLDPTVEPDPNPPQWTRNAKGVSYLCRSCPVITCRSNPAYVAEHHLQTR